MDGLPNPRDGFARAAPLPFRRAAVAVSSYDRPPRFSSDDPDANAARFGTKGSSPPRRRFALDTETFFFFFGASARLRRLLSSHDLEVRVVVVAVVTLVPGDAFALPLVAPWGSCARAGGGARGGGARPLYFLLLLLLARLLLSRRRARVARAARGALREHRLGDARGKRRGHRREAREAPSAGRLGDGLIPRALQAESPGFRRAESAGAAHVPHPHDAFAGGGDERARSPPGSALCSAAVGVVARRDDRLDARGVRASDGERRLGGRRPRVERHHVAALAPEVRHAVRARLREAHHALGRVEHADARARLRGRDGQPRLAHRGVRVPAGREREELGLRLVLRLVRDAALGHVPHGDVRVGARRHGDAPRAVHGERVHAAPVRAHRLERVPAIDGPDDQAAVHAAAHHARRLGGGGGAVERQARHRAFVPGERAEIRDRAVGVVVPDADEVVRAAGREEPALRRDALALREVRVEGERPSHRRAVGPAAAAAAPGQILHAVPEHEALVASRDQGRHRAGCARQAPVASAREHDSTRARLRNWRDEPTTRRVVRERKIHDRERNVRKKRACALQMFRRATKSSLVVPTAARLVSPLAA